MYDKELKKIDNYDEAKTFLQQLINNKNCRTDYQRIFTDYETKEIISIVKYYVLNNLYIITKTDMENNKPNKFLLAFSAERPMIPPTVFPIDKQIFYGQKIYSWNI